MIIAFLLPVFTRMEHAMRIVVVLNGLATSAPACTMHPDKQAGLSDVCDVNIAAASKQSRSKCV
jgi:hypothetical protein